MTRGSCTWKSQSRRPSSLSKTAAARRPLSPTANTTAPCRPRAALTVRRRPACRHFFYPPRRVVLGILLHTIKTSPNTPPPIFQPAIPPSSPDHTSDRRPVFERRRWRWWSSSLSSSSSSSYFTRNCIPYKMYTVYTQNEGPKDKLVNLPSPSFKCNNIKLKGHEILSNLCDTYIMVVYWKSHRDRVSFFLFFSDIFRVFTSSILMIFCREMVRYDQSSNILPY